MGPGPTLTRAQAAALYNVKRAFRAAAAANEALEQARSDAGLAFEQFPKT